MLIACEALLMLAFVAVFCRLRPRRPGRAFARLARRRALAVLLVGLFALAGSAAIALRTGWPQPHFTDEFSYLLAGDTFAHGRLSTPPHPLWVHLESFHVLQQPTYASRYPVAQGLFLALGQVLTGHSIVGVWLSVALACMAICWMLQAWLPPRWALLGALLATVRLVFWGHPFGPDDMQPGYWSQGYFGGAVAAGGGALVFGALRRLVRRPQVIHALLLALGLVVLANSRPYEGLACSLPALVLLLAWMLQCGGPALSVSLTRVVLPAALVLLPAAGAMAYYNYRVTGRPLTMPYQLYEDTYGAAPLFLWQPPRPVRHYTHKVFEENYLGWSVQEYRQQRTPAGLVRWAVLKCGKLMEFYLGLALVVSLTALRPALRGRWARFALLVCAVELFAFLLTAGGLPHYIAPVTGLLFFLVVQALRQVRLWRWHALPAGRAYVRALVPAYLVLAALSLGLEHRPHPEARYEQRARILEELRRDPGRHLVLVRYRPKPLGLGHEEWVYNEADIDAARVVWAREVGPEEDRRLLEYFKDRRVWWVDADAQPPRLTPYAVNREGEAPAEPARQEPRPPVPLAPPNGPRIDDFALRDHQGQLRRLADFRGRKLVCVTFLGVDCPLAKLYGPRLAELAREFEGRGVAFIGINSNHHESRKALASYARKHGIPFPLLKDPGNLVADRFGAERTPEVFVLDERRVVRYRGRIDDQYSVTVHRDRPTRPDLAVALEELLAGRPVKEPRTEATGCVIARIAPPAEGTVTYCRDVVPILQKHCQVCHRPGQSAPFALTSYRAASGWAATIREVLEEGRMPPWQADPRYGKFSNDPSLTAREKKLLLAWIDQDCPEGNPADSPPAAFPDGWTIQPDQVVTMPRPFTVPAQGTIEYQYFEADPGFREDKWIQAAEVRPGNRAVVHHCNVYLRPPGTQDLAETGTLGSYCLIASAQGTPPMVFPDGMAKLVPAGWRLVFVVHYTAVGSEQTDQTSVGLKFADPTTVRKEVATRLMYDPNLCIPPNVREHRVEQTWQVNRDVLLLALFPHMHLRGKSFRYEALYPDGKSEVLLDVPRYDFNWQHRYVLAAPKRLPAGSRLRCSAVYDNSADNPSNPDPSATVRAGTQSWEEMFNGYFDVVLADEDVRERSSPRAVLARGMRNLFRPGFAILFVAVGGLFLAGRRLGRRRQTITASGGEPSA